MIASDLCRTESSISKEIRVMVVERTTVLVEHIHVYGKKQKKKNVNLNNYYFHIFYF